MNQVFSVRKRAASARLLCCGGGTKLPAGPPDLGTRGQVADDSVLHHRLISGRRAAAANGDTERDALNRSRDKTGRAGAAPGFLRQKT